MCETVIKRDGRKVPYDGQKIVNAVLKAYKEMYPEKYLEYAGEIPVKMESTIRNIFYNKEVVDVEEIQDMIEETLADFDFSVCKAFIIYREERKKIRMMRNEIIQKAYDKINGFEIVNSNANVDENTFSGRMKESSGEIHKTMALYYALSPEIAKYHIDWYIYQHDNDTTVVGEHNCLNINLPKIFKNGFKTRNGDVRPAQCIESAFQLTAVAMQCQSQVQFGGVGSIHFDYDIAPYVRLSFVRHFIEEFMKMHCDDLMEKFLTFYDNLDDEGRTVPKVLIHKAKKRIKEFGLDPEDIAIVPIGETTNLCKEKFPEVYNLALYDTEIEGRRGAKCLFHNLNTLESRQGSQVPFTSINFGRDTSIEGRMVTKWLLQAGINGVGKFHRTCIFPISIFQYKKGINAKKGDPNYDLKQYAIYAMSKRIYPNWVNGDWSQAHEDPDNIDTFMSTMGCRTMIGYDQNGLGYSRQGRGNNVPNTMILPQLGIQYGICLGKRKTPDLDGFWNALELMLQRCEKALLERFEIMKRQSPKSAPFMYENGTIVDSENCKDTVFESLRHNTLAMGYIGIAEMCTALFGENHVHNKNILDFAVRVVKRIHDYAEDASKRHHLNFSCYATPAENLCYTAMNALRKQYGIIPGVTERSYLTNSHHVPVWEKVSIFEKIDIESNFCKYPTGGCITYVELDSMFTHNTKAIEDIIDYAFEEKDIPYLAFNFPIDSCLHCGFQGEFKTGTCTECGSDNIEQLRRVTGYLTTDYHNFNKGKQDEVLDRVKHSQITML